MYKTKSKYLFIAIKIILFLIIVFILKNGIESAVNGFIDGMVDPL